MRPSSYMTLPAVPDTFYWTDESWGPALRCRALDPIAPHLFTTRQLALTAAADWDRLAAAIGASRIAALTQVHGARVVLPGPDRPEADALVSQDVRIALAVRAADCVPLLLADSRTGGVGAVHAGWRGTAAGVARAAVERMVLEFDSNPADLVAAIGPSIGACCYEVGPELADAFLAAGHAPAAVGRWFSTPAGAARPRLDTWAANRDQLAAAGVPAQNIHICSLCTADHLTLFPSYRREKDRAGRIAGVIRARAR